eukprot:TRINITY_DN890_c0_g1_i7.p2 TRINITY_DN890_c0_g1~~TRINITY_DN890_c0_g1_i7.p2  ORF type:complete len:153 (+),score=5.36 TRINITY_DN890_c0_g1_i7:351-809(+)
MTMKFDPEYMLGVKRVVTEDEDEMNVHLMNRRVHTPIPDKVFLHKSPKVDEEETRRVLGRGYQNPECLEGCSMLGRLMANPTEEAWKVACWMLTYLWQGGPIIACSKKLAHVGLSRWRRVRQSENPLSPLETIARRSSMEFVPTAENLADLS